MSDGHPVILKAPNTDPIPLLGFNYKIFVTQLRYFHENTSDNYSSLILIFLYVTSRRSKAHIIFNSVISDLILLSKFAWT